MNLAPKPVVYALSLSLLSGVALLSGCAGKQPTTSDPVTSTTAPVASESGKQAERSTNTAPAAKHTSQAIPFEEVLKRDQEAAARKQAEQAKARQIDTELRSKVRTNPPLRPPKTTPTEPKPEQKAIKTPEPDTQKAEDIAPAPITETFPALQFTLDQLPITIQDTWVLSSSQNHCSLKTIAVSMDDGAGKTPIYLELTNNAWLIQTKSDIDMTYPDIGLFLSNGTQIPLESVVKDTRIAITKQKQQLTDALKTSERIRVALGFWPTWPVSKTRSKTISVAHFPQAFSAWETCNQRISAR